MSTFKTKPTHKFHSILNGNQFWWVAVLFPSKTIALQNVFFPISPWQRLIRQDLGCYLVWTSPPKKKSSRRSNFSLSSCKEETHMCRAEQRESSVSPWQHPTIRCVSAATLCLKSNYWRQKGEPEGEDERRFVYIYCWDCWLIVCTKWRCISYQKKKKKRKRRWSFLLTDGGCRGAGGPMTSGQYETTLLRFWSLFYFYFSPI